MQQEQVGELAAQVVSACLQDVLPFNRRREAIQEVLLSYPAWDSSSLGKCLLMIRCQVCIVKQNWNTLTMSFNQSQNWPVYSAIALLAPSRTR
jgi:hypothetical protein